MNDTKIEIIQHENDIVEVIFLDNDRAAVDAYLTYIEAMLLEKAEQEAQARLIVNFSRSGIPSMSYITGKIRNLLREHADKRRLLHLRGAFIASADDSLMLSLAETFTNILPIDATMKVFKIENYDDAKEWLTNDG